MMEHKLSLNTKPESNGVPTHDSILKKLKLLAISLNQTVPYRSPWTLRKLLMDLKMDEHLEEMLLMNLNH